jgi:hypothetical protein
MAQKCRLVAMRRHAGVALVGTKDQWMLTEIFRLPAGMEAGAKQARAGRGSARAVGVAALAVGGWSAPRAVVSP